MRSTTIDSFPGATRDYWVYDFETTKWMHIATLWRAANPSTGDEETDLGEVHVFVEDWAATSEMYRSCYVYNARKKYCNGSWHTYDHAYYSINDQENNPGTADGHDPNTQCEVREDSKIWLSTGGNFIFENRTLSGTTMNFTPKNNFFPTDPILTDIEYTIENDSTVNITWDYEKLEWAAQERFDIRIYSDEKFNNLVYKTGNLYPYDYESSEWEMGSDRRFSITNLDFVNNDKYFMRIVTKTIFGNNCWNSEPIEIKKSTAIEKKDEILPETLELKQNYPNPFNPSTKINYSISDKMKIDLAIYDINGKKICQLISGYKSQGNYSVIWNGKDDKNNSLPTGVYFTLLKSEKITLKKKMILLK